jgi:transposase
MFEARNLHAARWKLVAVYQHAAEADVAEFTRLARTVSTWEEDILNYHVTGISNGRPRATLGYMTPLEKFAEIVASTG